MMPTHGPTPAASDVERGPLQSESRSTVPPDGQGPKRRHQACERCWKRKQKCDKLLPSCKTCADLNVPCNSRKQEWNPSDSTSQVSVPRYIASLKQSVESLERASNKRPRFELNPSPNAPLSTGPVQEGLGTTNPHDGSPSTHAGGDEGPVHAAMGEIGLLSLGAMAELNNQSEDFPRHFALDRVILAAMAVANSDPSTAMASTTESSSVFALQSSFAINPVKVCPRESTSVFIHTFINEVGVFIPYLDSPTILSQYESVLADEKNNTLTQLSDFSMLSRTFNIYLAISTGMLLSPRSSGLEPVALTFHAAASRMVSRIVQLGDPLSIIHSLLSLIIFSLFSTNGGSTWYLIGLTMKYCVSLRLHKEPEDQYNFSHSEIERRRRLFWSAYVLDRSVSSVLDRPFSIHDADITIQALQEVPGSSQVAVESAFSYHLVTQGRIVSDIRSSRNRSVLFNYSNLTTWMEVQPAFAPLLSSSQTASLYFEQLVCRTHVQIVLLRSQGLLCSQDASQTDHKLEREAARICMHFINKLHDILDHGHFSQSFVLGYDVFSAGLVFICLALGGNCASEYSIMQTTKLVSKCSTILTIIGERFSVIKTLRKIFWAFSSRVMEGPNSTDNATLQNLPSSVPYRIRQGMRQFLGSDFVGFGLKKPMIGGGTDSLPDMSSTFGSHQT